MSHSPEKEETAWAGWRQAWDIDPSTIYLNHGSFGPSPSCVRKAREDWSERLERQPMDFFVRQMESHLMEASEALGALVGAESRDLCFVDNATTAMNVVAESVPLSTGDQVMLTNHEYGAVMRIWRRACERRGAEFIVQKLPDPPLDAEETVSALMKGVTEKTRLIVISHVTSPTALILPVEAICQAAQKRNVPVCIDGPHAVAMRPIHLKKMGCSFYCASGHKWLCAPFGSGFLYVARPHQSSIVAPVLSWGGSVSGRVGTWQDELNWLGTRDPAAFLALPRAIKFLDSCGLEAFRSRCHGLVREAGRRITALTGRPSLAPLDSNGYGTMLACELPASRTGAPAPGKRDPLQNALWERHRIEIPIVHWHGRRLIRVSCHLYNGKTQIDRLMEALQELLPETSIEQ